MIKNLKLLMKTHFYLRLIPFLNDIAKFLIMNL